MTNKKIEINYSEYESVKDMKESDFQCVNSAEDNLKNAYAPYSKFKVSSLVQLDNGIKILGTNQENMAYPSGLCAERVAIFSAKSQYPDNKVEQVFIVTEQGNETPFSPCGACRQVIMEYEMNQKTPIQIILKSGNSKIWKFNSMKDLLPFAFEAEEILKKD